MVGLSRLKNLKNENIFGGLNNNNEWCFNGVVKITTFYWYFCGLDLCRNKTSKLLVIETVQVLFFIITRKPKIMKLKFFKYYILMKKKCSLSVTLQNSFLIFGK